MSTIFTQAAEATVNTAAAAVAEAAAPVATEAAAATTGATVSCLKKAAEFIVANRTPIIVVAAATGVVAGAYAGYKWYKGRNAK